MTHSRRPAPSRHCIENATVLSGTPRPRLGLMCWSKGSCSGPRIPPKGSRSGTPGLRTLGDASGEGPLHPPQSRSGPPQRLGCWGLGTSSHSPSWSPSRKASRSDHRRSPECWTWNPRSQPRQGLCMASHSPSHCWSCPQCKNPAEGQDPKRMLCQSTLRQLSPSPLGMQTAHLRRPQRCVAPL